jgi:alpha-L-rhamnosidase
MTGAVRTIIEADPFRDVSQRVPWPQRGRWPATWIACPDVGEPPFVTAFRCRFSVDADAIGRIHVTADERYELFLDGVRIGRGSERGTPDAWSFETYDLTLEPGPHILVARAWTLGAQAPFAQFHVRSGFLLAAEGGLHERLSTGVAGWEAKRLDGYEFVDPTPAWGTGSNLRVDGAAFPWVSTAATASAGARPSAVRTRWAP